MPGHNSRSVVNRGKEWGETGSVGRGGWWFQGGFSHACGCQFIGELHRLPLDKRDSERVLGLVATSYEYKICTTMQLECEYEHKHE